MFSRFSIRLFMSQTYTKARVFRKKDKKKKLAANKHKAYSIPTAMSSCLDIALFKNLQVSMMMH